MKPFRLRPNVQWPILLLILALAFIGHASADSVTFTGSSGDNPATGNSGVKNHGPLVQYSTQFNFLVGQGFSLNQLGNSVIFQYGTFLSDNHYEGRPVPVPESDLLSTYAAALLMGGFLLRRILMAQRFKRPTRLEPETT